MCDGNNPSNFPVAGNYMDISYNNFEQCYINTGFQLQCNGFTTIPLNIDTTSLNTMTYFLGLIIRPCLNGTMYGLYYQNSLICAGACAAGTYGTGASNSGGSCSNICSAGFYCPSGSISEIICPAGTYNSLQGRGSITDCLNCPIGYYCPAGTSNPLLNPCLAGYYGNTTNNINNQCNGKCTAGYKCPAGSISSTASTCGNSNIYCPIGTSIPIPVSSGYFTSGGSSFDTATSQKI